jgi:hypothetical protein
LQPDARVLIIVLKAETLFIGGHIFKDVSKTLMKVK